MLLGQSWQFWVAIATALGVPVLVWLSWRSSQLGAEGNEEWD